MSLSCYPHFVRFCSVASGVNATNVDCEAYRLRVAAIPLFDLDGDEPYFHENAYYCFVKYYLKVLQTKKIDIDDVIYSLWHIAVKYYTEEERELIKIDTSLLRDLFKEYDLIN